MGVALVEDSEDDELLLQRALIRDGHTPFIRRVDSSNAMHAALCDETWDLVLADWNLPRFSALIALEMIKRTGLDLPFIISFGNDRRRSSNHGYESRRPRFCHEIQPREAGASHPTQSFGK